MLKKKYEKPVSRDLSSIEIARGSCWSGSGEKTINVQCLTGGLAISSCAVGTNVYDFTVCTTTGSHAGGSCFNGTDAG